jgi:hypothetical protein
MSADAHSIIGFAAGPIFNPLYSRCPEQLRISWQVPPLLSLCHKAREKPKDGDHPTTSYSNNPGFQHFNIRIQLNVIWLVTTLKNTQKCEL